ncbi:MAG: ribonuclease HII [Luteitalea sp.]|nr:ribonuclease HII [Luteitalea sp.]
MVRGARRTHENLLRRQGYARIAGVDEVGRGCLAGPVTAAAVILNPGRRCDGLRDSKLLTAARREWLYGTITRRALTWAVASCEPPEIDELNIHRATLVAMHRAVLALDPLPDYVLIDAFRVPDLAVPQEAVVGGDRRCAAIAAASIVAKVTRDRLMRALHEADARYGFDRHKGYATATHLAAIRRYGYSAIHRKTFRPPTLFDLFDTIGEA